MPWDVEEAVRGLASIWRLSIVSAENQLLSNLRGLVAEQI
jgi:hypothetical protein